MSVPSRGSVAFLARLASIFILFPLAACGHPDNAPPKEPRPAPTSADAIPVAPLSGKLLDQPFTIKSARYYVDQRPGYQKIVLKLYGVDSPTPCTDLTPRKPPEVWLRHNGPERAEPSTTKVDLDGRAPWEVHYQIQRNGRWAGNGDARALFVITQVDPDMKMHGELSACFRDATGSCVAGRFVANYCRIWIDSPVRGSDVMEHPPKNLPKDTPDIKPPADSLPSVPPTGADDAPGASGSAAPVGSAPEQRR